MEELQESENENKILKYNQIQCENKLPEIEDYTVVRSSIEVIETIQKTIETVVEEKDVIYDFKHEKTPYETSNYYQGVIKYEFSSGLQTSQVVSILLNQEKSNLVIPTLEDNQESALIKIIRNPLNSTNSRKIYSKTLKPQTAESIEIDNKNMIKVTRRLHIPMNQNEIEEDEAQNYLNQDILTQKSNYSIAIAGRNAYTTFDTMDQERWKSINSSAIESKNTRLSRYMINNNIRQEDALFDGNKSRQKRNKHQSRNNDMVHRISKSVDTRQQSEIYKSNDSCQSGRGGKVSLSRKKQRKKIEFYADFDRETNFFKDIKVKDNYFSNLDKIIKIQKWWNANKKNSKIAKIKLIQKNVRGFLMRISFNEESYILYILNMRFDMLCRLISNNYKKRCFNSLKLLTGYKIDETTPLRKKLQSKLTQVSGLNFELSIKQNIIRSKECKTCFFTKITYSSSIDLDTRKIQNLYKTRCIKNRLENKKGPENNDRQENRQLSTSSSKKLGKRIVIKRTSKKDISPGIKRVKPLNKLSNEFFSKSYKPIVPHVNTIQKVMKSNLQIHQTEIKSINQLYDNNLKKDTNKCKIIKVIYPNNINRMLLIIQDRITNKSRSLNLATPKPRAILNPYIISKKTKTSLILLNFLKLENAMDEYKKNKRLQLIEEKENPENEDTNNLIRRKIHPLAYSSISGKYSKLIILNAKSIVNTFLINMKLRKDIVICKPWMKNRALYKKVSKYTCLNRINEIKRRFLSGKHTKLEIDSSINDLFIIPKTAPVLMTKNNKIGLPLEKVELIQNSIKEKLMDEKSEKSRKSISILLDMRFKPRLDKKQNSLYLKEYKTNLPYRNAGIITNGLIPNPLTKNKLVINKEDFSIIQVLPESISERERLNTENLLTESQDTNNLNADILNTNHLNTEENKDQEKVEEKSNKGEPAPKKKLSHKRIRIQPRKSQLDLNKQQAEKVKENTSVIKQEKAINISASAVSFQLQGLENSTFYKKYNNGIIDENAVKIQSYLHHPRLSDGLEIKTKYINQLCLTKHSKFKFPDDLFSMTVHEYIVKANSRSNRVSSISKRPLNIEAKYINKSIKSSIPDISVKKINSAYKSILTKSNIEKESEHILSKPMIDPIYLNKVSRNNSEADKNASKIQLSFKSKRNKDIDKMKSKPVSAYSYQYVSDQEGSKLINIKTNIDLTIMTKVSYMLPENSARTIQRKIHNRLLLKKSLCKIISRRSRVDRRDDLSKHMWLWKLKNVVPEKASDDEFLKRLNYKQCYFFLNSLKNNYRKTARLNEAVDKILDNDKKNNLDRKLKLWKANAYSIKNCNEFVSHINTNYLIRFTSRLRQNAERQRDIIQKLADIGEGRNKYITRVYLRLWKINSRIPYEMESINDIFIGSRLRAPNKIEKGLDFEFEERHKAFDYESFSKINLDYFHINCYKRPQNLIVEKESQFTLGDLLLNSKEIAKLLNRICSNDNFSYDIANKIKNDLVKTNSETITFTALEKIIKKCEFSKEAVNNFELFFKRVKDEFSKQQIENIQLDYSNRRFANIEIDQKYFYERNGYLCKETFTGKPKKGLIAEFKVNNLQFAGTKTIKTFKDISQAYDISIKIDGIEPKPKDLSRSIEHFNEINIIRQKTTNKISNSKETTVNFNVFANKVLKTFKPDYQNIININYISNYEKYQNIISRPFSSIFIRGIKPSSKRLINREENTDITLLNQKHCGSCNCLSNKNCRCNCHDIPTKNEEKITSRRNITPPHANNFEKTIHLEVISDADDDDEDIIPDEPAKVQMTRTTGVRIEHFDTSIKDLEEKEKHVNIRLKVQKHSKEDKQSDFEEDFFTGIKKISHDSKKFRFYKPTPFQPFENEQILTPDSFNSKLINLPGNEESEKNKNDFRVKKDDSDKNSRYSKNSDTITKKKYNKIQGESIGVFSYVSQNLVEAQKLMRKSVKPKDQMIYRQHYGVDDKKDINFHTYLKK